MLADVVAQPDEKTRPPRAAGDDREAASFEAIYERHGTRVLNLAYRMTGNEETARDLAQEVWIKVFERLDTFEARSDVFTWIYRITVNHALNHMKRERRVRWLDLLDRSVGEVLREEKADPAFLERTEAPRADAVIEADERALRVWQAIQALDPKYRVPLVLFHYEELSYQEIADTMKLSMAAVEARIHRARKQLAKTLSPLLDRI
jgi:RNA polymerase sigma-70 factor (ECF subfamily)